MFITSMTRWTTMLNADCYYNMSIASGPLWYFVDFDAADQTDMMATTAIHLWTVAQFFPLLKNQHYLVNETKGMQKGKEWVEFYCELVE